jgi:hypothetical protein
VGPIGGRPTPQAGRTDLVDIPGRSVLTELIGLVPRFPHKFGSQEVGTEERTVQFGSGLVLFRF